MARTREVISVVAASLQAHEDSAQKDFIVDQLRNLEQELQKLVDAEHGVRWSEFARLPYWDSASLLVFDPLNNMPLGIPKNYIALGN